MTPAEITAAQHRLRELQKNSDSSEHKCVLEFLDDVLASEGHDIAELEANDINLKAVLARSLDELQDSVTALRSLILLGEFDA